MPDIVYDTLEAIPEGLRENAKKGDDGKFTVKVVLQSKLDEFRDSNIRVSKERDDLLAVIKEVKPFIGEDPAAFAVRLKALEEIEVKVKDGSLKGSNEISSEVENRVKAMRTDFERQLAEKAGEAALKSREADAWQQRHMNSLVDRAVTDAVVSPASGALPDALEDILARARNVFKINSEGKIVAMDGQAIRYGADGATPMSPVEWLVDLRKKAGYLFKGSNGGGANGGSNDRNSATFGFTPADYAKLSPAAKLALVHKNGRTAKSEGAYRA